jgi:hypothetical protein
MATIRFEIENEDGETVNIIEVFASSDGKVMVSSDGHCEMWSVEARQLARVIEACAEAAES